jgi:hypothetical protein
VSCGVSMRNDIERRVLVCFCVRFYVLLSIGVLFKLWHISSNVGSLLSMLYSFICIPCLLVRNMRYFSNLFKYFPFLAVLTVVVVFVINSAFEKSLCS